MREWIKPEISAIDISMTENGHNHQRWEEYTRSQNSQSGYRPTVNPVYPDGDDSTQDTGDTNQFS